MRTEEITVLWVSPSACRLDAPCVSDKSSIWAVNSPWVKRIAHTEQSSPTHSLDLTMSSNPAKEVGVLSAPALVDLKFGLNIQVLFVCSVRAGGREAAGNVGIMQALSFHLEVELHLRNTPVLISWRTLCLA